MTRTRVDGAASTFASRWVASQRGGGLDTRWLASLAGALDHRSVRTCTRLTEKAPLRIDREFLLAAREVDRPQGTAVTRAPRAARRPSSPRATARPAQRRSATSRRRIRAPPAWRRRARASGGGDDPDLALMPTGADPGEARSLFDGSAAARRTVRTVRSVTAGSSGTTPSVSATDLLAGAGSTATSIGRRRYPRGARSTSFRPTAGREIQRRRACFASPQQFAALNPQGSRAVVSALASGA